MKKFMLLGMFVALISGCTSNSLKLDDIGAIDSPTTLKSIDDLPKPATTPAEIKHAGAIRVVAESAKGQDQYAALAAARGVAQKNLLSIVNGVNINSDSLIQKGELSREEITLIVEGHLRAFDCGAFYNRANQTGYYCMELPLK